MYHLSFKQGCISVSLHTTNMVCVDTVVVKINLTFFVMPLQLHGRFKRPHASPTVLYADACSLHLINKFFDRRSRTPFAGTLSPFARTFLHAH